MERWTKKRWVYNSMQHKNHILFLTLEKKKPLKQASRDVEKCVRRLIFFSRGRRTNMERYEHYKMLLNHAEKRREAILND